MFINRCPHCGEELSFFESFFMKIGRVWPVKCPYCDNKYVDTAPAEELFIAGNRFFIFFKEKQIGEGVIKKLDY